MRRWLKVVLAVVVILVVAAATFLIPTIWGKPWSIDHFYARVFLEFALDSPMLLSQLRVLEPMGLEFHNDDLDDQTVEFQKRQAAQLVANLEMLRSYDTSGMTRDEKLSYDVLDWFLENQANNAKYQFHGYSLNQFFGAQNQLPNFMTTTHVIDSEGAAENYVTRLSKVGIFFDQVIESVKHSEELGVVPPKFVVTKTKGMMETFIAGPAKENALYTVLKEKIEKLEEMDEAARADLLARAEAEITRTVYPAYERLIAYSGHLESVAGDDHGVWHLPDGAAYYKQQLRSFTTSDLTADEVHEIGLREMARIQGEMRAILRSEGLLTGNIAATIQRLNQDKRFLYPDTDEGRQQILDEYQRIIDEVSEGISPMFDIVPEASVNVERIPEFQEEGAPGAYYRPPPLDKSRGGTFYVNLRSVGEQQKFNMRTLAYHEGVPGHHFQIALAQEIEDVPFFRKFGLFGAYVEGWALYAEQVAAENGFQDDPYDRLGFLMSQAFRAARLVVDTGLHAKRWTREQAIDYMVKNTGMNRSEIITEVERYIVLPGQACSYMVGQLKILELRTRAKQKLGETFDIREFHNVVLTNGALPLTLLERVVDDWIAEKTD